MASALKRLFRIQYVSDLHLEHLEKCAFPSIATPSARYLALAGDICQPSHSLFTSFLEYTSRNWERVFYVAGNHEYYAGCRSHIWTTINPSALFETQAQIKAICNRFKNIHFLHHDYPVHYLPTENVAVIGTTLWTHVPPDHIEIARKGMNDYSVIPLREEDGTLKPLDPETTNIFHAKERAMLEAQIDYWGAKRAQVCVITHHMPSFGFISPRYADSPLNVCFASNCEPLMKPHVRAWIYGHTHNSATTIVGNTINVVNARGYPGESVPGFCRDAWVEFPMTDIEASIEYDELVAAISGVKPYLPETKNSEESIELC
jgi:hypothetical protein